MQYAYDDGPIHLYNIWTRPISETIEVMEEIASTCVVGFNLVFDWFHFQQTWSTLKVLESEYGGDIEPRDYVEEYALAEKEARDYMIALKPQKCFDLMLHARKGPYQNTMNRKPIIIKRVPTALAWLLRDELDQKIKLKDVYFARNSDPTQRWQVDDTFNEYGDVVPEFKNVVLRFAASSALKALAQDALDVDDVKLFADIMPPASAKPVETGFAPFALAPFIAKDKTLKVPGPKNWHGKWPHKIWMHIQHWEENQAAREYAEADVHYTRALFQHFDIQDHELNDNDSVLACMVGSLRWIGFKTDRDGIGELRQKALKRMAEARINFNSQHACRDHLIEVMNPVEQAGLIHDKKVSTKATILEEVATWTVSTVCDTCYGDGCSDCGGSGVLKSDEKHLAAIRAQEILDARRSKKEVEIYEKLFFADRFHASFKIIGARSSRMSGTDGLNAQGINHAKYVRECFPLAWDGYVLCGGDLEGSQVSIADAVFQDPTLHKELLSGKKLYGIFGTYLFPGMTYDDILATKGLPGEKDRYDRSKKAVLAMLFGGEAYTLATRVGISEDAAEEAFRKWDNDHPVWRRKRQKYFDMFCSMRQPEEKGKVYWSEPAEFVEAMFGFRRYFTLENEICHVLFNLGEDPPEAWRRIRGLVVRTDREQTLSGALRSACFAAAFALQAANMRAAANHVIQSPEAILVKRLQRRLWDLQPEGAHLIRLMPMNIHDEVMCPTLPEYVDAVAERVQETIESYKKDIPLLGMTWSKQLKSWANK
jgi:hypothetical protein